MDSIINKLTEIESAASAIVQHAEAEKSALDEKFDKKRMDFDKELEADTQRQIQEIRDKLEAETSRILSGQSQESQDELNALQKEYNEKYYEEMLSVELSDLQDQSFDLSLLGFDAGELDKLLGAGNEKDIADDDFDLTVTGEIKFKR